MARLDVYPRPGRDRRGYVLDVQAGLLANLSTRTVVLLLPAQDLQKPIRELNPIFTIRGESGTSWLRRPSLPYRPSSLGRQLRPWTPTTTK